MDLETFEKAQSYYNTIKSANECIDDLSDLRNDIENYGDKCVLIIQYGGRSIIFDPKLLDIECISNAIIKELEEQVATTEELFDRL